MEQNEDVSIGLLEEIRKSFNLGYENSDTIKGCLEKLEQKKADYDTAHDFAIEVGEILSDAFKNVTASDLPNEKMYYNIAKKLIEPTLITNHKLISDFAKNTQEVLNESAKIGLKAVGCELNKSRVNGLIRKVADAENYEDVSWVLNDPLVQFGQSVVDDTLKDNADLHFRAGLHPVITRKVRGDACDWCMNLAGTYVYPEKIPSEDIFHRHKRCRCVVTYNPRDGKGIQNVWSKKWTRK